MKLNKVTYFILVLVCLALLGKAQKVDSLLNSDSSITKKIQELEDVVVTAQYTPNSINKSTYKIKVVDSSKIQALAAVNLKDALSKELNIRFSNDPILGSGMSLQGLSGQNVKILIDGVPIIGKQNGNIDLSQINLSNVERIEIVEGPLAVSYGTDALAGVINIITRKPKSGTKFIESTLYYESNNTYNASVGAGYSKNKHGFSLNVNRNYFNGWDLDDKYYLIPKRTVADTNRNKSWKPKEQYFGDIQYQFKKEKLSLNFRSAAFHEEIINRGVPLKPYFETAFDDNYKTIRLDNSLSINLKFKNYKTFNTIISYNYFKRFKTTVFTDLTDLSEQLAGDPSLQDTAIFAQLMTRGSFISNKPYQVWSDTVLKKSVFSYDIGYDLNYNAAQGKRIENGKKEIGDYAVFTSCEIQPIKDFVIRPGIRYSYNTVYDAPLIPSLNLKYNYSNWSFRTSYAKGFRAPDLKELYFEFVDINHQIFGNTLLKAEQSDNYNLNVRYNRKKEKLDFVFDVSGFYNSIKNLITLAMGEGNQYSYFNIGQFKTYGTSFNTNITYKQISISAGGSVIYRYNTISEEENSVSAFSPTPELRSSLQYKIKKWKTSINCFYKYTGEMPGFVKADDGTIGQTFISDFHMLDFNIAKELFKKKVILSVGAKNLLNVNNVRASLTGGAHSGNSSSTPIAMGRTYFIKMSYAFKK